MQMVQCMTCGWADLALSDHDAEMKAAGHEVKTGCTGVLWRRKQ